MKNYDRFLTPEDKMVLEAIRHHPTNSEGIRAYCRDRGIEIKRTDVHTRKLHRYGYIIRSTSDHRYSNVWEVM